MNSSVKNNIRSSNPFERIIFEKGLRAIDLRIYKKQDLMVAILNNGTAIQVKLSEYPVLKNASVSSLSNHQFVHNGTGFYWKSLRYDISLKNLLEKSAVMDSLQKIEYTGNLELA